MEYKSEKELAELPARQLAILKNAARYVKKGGALVYSTCTVLQEENEFVVQAFLSEMPSFTKENLPAEFVGPNEGSVTLLPPEWESDGFYICCLRNEI